MGNRYKQCSILLATLAVINVPALAIDSMAEAYASQARRCWERGETAHAVKLYQQAIEQEVADANDELYQALLFNNLGECYRRIADEPSQRAKLDFEESSDSCLTKAEENFKKALEIKEEKSSSSTNFIYIARSLENLASAYKSHNKTMEAEALYRKAIAIREEKEGKDAPSCASDYLAIGEILTVDRHFAEALDSLKRGLALYAATCSANDTVIGVCHQKIAVLFLNWGKLSSAGDEYDKAMQIFSRNPGSAKKYISNLKTNMPNFPEIAYSDAYSNFEKVRAEPNASKASKNARINNMIKAARRMNSPASDINLLQRQIIR